MRDNQKNNTAETGESVSVPKKRIPFWKAGKELSDRVDLAYLKQLEQKQRVEL